jgi:hypothetical protein|tara:strand:+ start:633 stop:1463 length:831 start_codon:yes stop_codon:yes gene_type:complete
MKVTCKGKEFEQYECDEINALGIKTVENWRDAEIGDWIRTHDDKALQVTGRRFKTLKGKRKQITFVRTGFGETPTYYAKVYAKQQKDWSGNDLIYKQYVRNVPATVLQKQFADYISKYGELDKNGKFDTASIVDAYTSAFSDNNPKQALRRGVRILRKKYISDRISVNIRETLLEHGMDDNWIVSQYRDIIDSSPPNAKLNALNRVSELLGHTAKEKEAKTQNIIMISDGDKKLLAEARQKLSDKDIGRLMNVVKNKGIQGVIDAEDTQSDDYAGD